jgi:spore coat protein A
MSLTRRTLLRLGATSASGLFLASRLGPIQVLYAREAPAGLLDATLIPQFLQPLIVPPAMPRTRRFRTRGKPIDYYEVAVRQFTQQVLPPGLPPTTVWSYGSANHAGSFNFPAFTIEAKYEAPVRVRWINDLKDPGSGAYLPHLLPVDQTLHWANPPGGASGRDMTGSSQLPYTGPVPMVTHVHGAHTTEESDGYSEAWYLPDASDIPDGYATEGGWYARFAAAAEARQGAPWTRGSATFQYPNDQAAATLWYHDHTIGMTRLNVYAGPAGFYLLRGGPGDEVIGTLPGPAPALGDPAGMPYYEIPIAIQDRSFRADGRLFYPDSRAFFEGLTPDQLRIPFAPDLACDGRPSDIAPIWNPEFFGTAMVVNGRTWPYLEVERRRYRFRLLNGCNSRFLILDLDGMPLWQIGAEGGFLPAPVPLTQLLLAPAERADVIVDFSDVPAGTRLVLRNLGPDEPFGGGEPDDDFDRAADATTGRVMEFRVVPRVGPDRSTPPAQLVLPPPQPLPEARVTRRLSLNEEDSRSVRVVEDADGGVSLACGDEDGEPFGPAMALLGTVDDEGHAQPLGWTAAVTETPVAGETELWEIHNRTMDAHPIHLHQVAFEVVDRAPLPHGDHGPAGEARPPEPSETGRKDTVIAYPDEVTRIKATFDLPGRYVWHCHIVEHEDNEMMRPVEVLPPASTA